MLKFITMEHGAQYAIIHGISEMPTLFAVCWATPMLYKLPAAANTVREKGRYGLKGLPVLVKKQTYSIARTEDGERIAVAIERTQV